MLDFHDPTAVYVPPAVWTGDHVMHRMTLAFETLMRIPVRILPSGYGSGWPEYVVEFSDIVHRRSAIGGESQDEVEMRFLREQSEDQDRRLLPPKERDVSLMEEAIWWPVKYLGGDRANNVKITRWAARAARGYPGGRSIVLVEQEARQIARGLASDRVAVR
jgi:hypothetical protein